MKRLLRNQLAKEQSAPSPYKSEDIDVAALLAKYGNEQMPEQKESGQSLATSLIYALGPAALSGLSGDSAGASAGVEAQKLSDRMLEQDAKNRSQKQAMTRLSSGTRLKAIADLANAKNKGLEAEATSELNVAKFKQEMFKEAVDMATKMYERGDIKREKLYETIFNVQKEINGLNKEGINKVLEQEQKQLDRDSGLEKAKINASAMKARQQQPTESERKNANIAAALRQGEEAYQRYLKSVGGKPISLTDPAYDNYKSVIEKGDPNTLMSVILSKIPEGPARRQMQAEIKWTAAKLRGDSGAAINAGEFIQENAAHFPRRNDDPETIAEKDAARQQVLSSMTLNAGRAPIAKTVQPKEVPQPKMDEAALRYSQMHNISYEKAVELLNLRRGKNGTK
jgi:hypothetical protein